VRVSCATTVLSNLSELRESENIKGPLSNKQQIIVDICFRIPSTIFPYYLTIIFDYRDYFLFFGKYAEIRNIIPFKIEIINVLNSSKNICLIDFFDIFKIYNNRQLLEVSSDISLVKWYATVFGVGWTCLQSIVEVAIITLDLLIRDEAAIKKKFVKDENIVIYTFIVKTSQKIYNTLKNFVEVILTLKAPKDPFDLYIFLMLSAFFIVLNLIYYNAPLASADNPYWDQTLSYINIKNNRIYFENMKGFLHKVLEMESEEEFIKLAKEYREWHIYDQVHPDDRIARMVSERSFGLHAFNYGHLNEILYKTPEKAFEKHMERYAQFCKEANIEMWPNGYGPKELYEHAPRYIYNPHKPERYIKAPEYEYLIYFTRLGIQMFNLYVLSGKICIYILSLVIIKGGFFFILFVFSCFYYKNKYLSYLRCIVSGFLQKKLDNYYIFKNQEKKLFNQFNFFIFFIFILFFIHFFNLFFIAPPSNNIFYIAETLFYRETFGDKIYLYTIFLTGIEQYEFAIRYKY